MNAHERRAWNYLSAYRNRRRAASTHATCLADLLDLKAMVQPLIDDVVIDMRRAGYTWAEIGECMGVTQQAVAKRYNK